MTESQPPGGGGGGGGGGSGGGNTGMSLPFIEQQQQQSGSVQTGGGTSSSSYKLGGGGRRVGISHPAPPAPSPSKATPDNDESSLRELEALAVQMGEFKWSEDIIENCSRLLQGYARAGETGVDSVASAKAKGIAQLKALLCTSRDKVFEIAQDAIDGGLLPILVGLIADENLEVDIRLGAAFCLTNVAAGYDSQTAEVVRAGALTPMLNLLKSPIESLRRQAVFCLANIAGSTSEYRRALAEHPAYFENIAFAATNTVDKRIEELAAWNLRNMCVLGGPPIQSLSVGLEFFADQILRNCPAEIVCREALTANSRLTRMYYPDDWAAADPTQPLSLRSLDPFIARQDFAYRSIPGFEFLGPTGGAGSFMGRLQPMATYPPAILRFAAEAMSWVSRSPEGRIFIHNAELLLPLLYLGRFSSNQSVRNGSLESLANTLLFGPSAVRKVFEDLDGVEVCAEILADAVQYNPHQRAWACRCIIAVVMDLGPFTADEMLLKKIVTTEAAKRLAENRAEEESSWKRNYRGGYLSRRGIRASFEGGGSSHHIRNTSLLIDGTPKIRQANTVAAPPRKEEGGAGGEEENMENSGVADDEELLNRKFDSSDDELTAIDLDEGGDHHRAGWGEAGGGLDSLQDRKGRIVPVLEKYGISVMEIAYRIYFQIETYEEIWLREHAALLMLAILNSVSDGGLKGLVSSELVKLMVNLMEFLISQEVKTSMSGSTIGMILGQQSATTTEPPDWISPDFFPPAWSPESSTQQQQQQAATSNNSSTIMLSTASAALNTPGSLIAIYQRAQLALGKKVTLWLNFLSGYLGAITSPSLIGNSGSFGGKSGRGLASPSGIFPHLLAYSDTLADLGDTSTTNTPSGQKSLQSVALDFFLGAPYSLASIYLFVRLISIGEELRLQEQLDCNPIGMLIDRASSTSDTATQGLLINAVGPVGGSLRQRIELSVASSPLPIAALSKVIELIQTHCFTP